jgi:hypothetical protein
MAAMRGQRTATSGEINFGFVDPYTLVHGLVGVVAAAVGLRFVGMLALAIGWEIAEHLLKLVVPSVFPHVTQDTFQNSCGDVLATMLGWGLARLLHSLLHGTIHDDAHP